MSMRDRPESAGAPARAIRYRVRHVTDYRYQTSVVLAHHLLHLKPRPASDQSITAQRVMITPKPLVTAEHDDCFANPATYIAIQEPHIGLTIESELEVERRSPAAVDLAATPPWETLRDQLAAATERAA